MRRLVGRVLMHRQRHRGDEPRLMAIDERVDEREAKEVSKR